MKTNIFVLYGGKSVEHEVSIKTATAIMNALDREKYNVYALYINKKGEWSKPTPMEAPVDPETAMAQVAEAGIVTSLGRFLVEYWPKGETNVIFPAIHGSNGEDGTLQGLLELLELPYVGNGVAASAIGIDKAIMKDLFRAFQLPQGKYLTFPRHRWEENPARGKEMVGKELGYPCYVKPARLGSSVGISRCQDETMLEEAVQEAFRYDNKIVIEEELLGREMQIAVVGNEKPQASVVGEYILERSFMDYNAKYVDGKLIPVIPAKLPPTVSEAMRETALKAFEVLNASGLLRVDYFVTPGDQFYINEVNTMPGFTNFSMFPALWERTNGTTYSQLLDWLIELALERYQRERGLVKELLK